MLMKFTREPGLSNLSTVKRKEGLIGMLKWRASRCYSNESVTNKNNISLRVAPLCPVIKPFFIPGTKTGKLDLVSSFL